ncbi:hypothetical protein FHP24_25305 [Aliirhizobium smilacinae]|uniref:Uncharacterized protein n=1 Tax=Aliirhizobium smilacinae TaxID=1395944 RepID=A0A5C4XCY7_9HYPH|nr:hypothetical protein FHP24_25305 [Rhizobium smilacinae]
MDDPSFAVSPNGDILHFCRSHCRQIFAFQSGDLFAQGKKLLLRRGVACHGVSSISKCSLYVLIDSRAHWRSQQPQDRNLFLICYSDDSYLEKKEHRPYMSPHKRENPWLVLTKPTTGRIAMRQR